METLRQDLRFALRLLLKKPGFTITAIITVALGIGANTAIFSVVNGVLLKPMPYPEPELLLTMRSNQSTPDLDDVKSQSTAFAALGGIVTQALDYTGEAEPLQVQAGLCNADLFQALGVNPAFGRVISADEDRVGAERVVVLSHSFWREHFDGDQAIIGKSIPLSGSSYAIVGVMPADFVMPRENPDLWVSVRVANPVAAQFRGVHFLRTYLRLKPGFTVAQASADMEPIDRWLEQQYPQDNKGRHTQLIPLHERVVGGSRTELLLFFGAVGLVLLIACANFANLMLSRAASRVQEIVIRTALGAGRVRIIRQVLTESVLIAVAGGVFGLLLAYLGVNLLLSLKPANLPRPTAIRIDGIVLGFSMALSIVAGLAAGLVPALAASKLNVSEGLKQGSRSTAGRSSPRVRRLLVVGELAVSVVLLIGAGLLIKGFVMLQRVNPGFQSGDLLTARLELPESRYKDIPRQIQFRTQLLDSLNATPGVEASMISELPLSGENLMHNFVIERRPPLEPGLEPELETRTVTRGYFATMGIPVLQGRDFAASDRADAPSVGLVNEAFVHEYFPEGNAIGARIRWARGPVVWMTIIGVVGNVKHYGLNRPEEAAFYNLYEQQDQPWKRWMYVAVRTDRGFGSALSEVKRRVWALDSQIPLTKVRPMNSVIEASVEGERFTLILFSIFAGVALILATVGLYGVISHAVSQSTHEIGIRMALGAGRHHVMRLVIGNGMRLLTIGMMIGLAASYVFMRLMTALLFEVTATDPLTYLLVSIVLSGVALAACYIPARRAMRVDPMVALREE